MVILNSILGDHFLMINHRKSYMNKLSLAVCGLETMRRRPLLGNERLCGDPSSWPAGPHGECSAMCLHPLGPGGGRVVMPAWSRR